MPVYTLRRYIQGHTHRRIISDLLGLMLVCTLAAIAWDGERAADSSYRKADRAACVRIEQLKAVAHAQLVRALKTLPTLSYYKQHPAELERAIDQTHDQLQEFRAINC